MSVLLLLTGYMVAKSIRKSVSFDESEGDRALLDAIAAHQSQHEQSFSDLCKQALHQYLLSREPTQSVLLFMELQHQIAQLGTRVAVLEDEATISAAFGHAQAVNETPVPTAEKTVAAEEETVAAENDHNTVDDPLLNRLGPLLLDDF